VVAMCAPVCQIERSPFEKKHQTREDEVESGLSPFKSPALTCVFTTSIGHVSTAVTPPLAKPMPPRSAVVMSDLGFPARSA
jgi:hypothetical protein